MPAQVPPKRRDCSRTHPRSRLPAPPAAPGSAGRWARASLATYWRPRWRCRGRGGAPLAGRRPPWGSGVEARWVRQGARCTGGGTAGGDRPAACTAGAARGARARGGAPVKHASIQPAPLLPAGRQVSAAPVAVGEAEVGAGSLQRDGAQNVVGPVAAQLVLHGSSMGGRAEGSQCVHARGRVDQRARPRRPGRPAAAAAGATSGAVRPPARRTRSFPANSRSPVAGWNSRPPALRMPAVGGGQVGGCGGQAPRAGRGLAGLRARAEGGGWGRPGPGGWPPGCSGQGSSTAAHSSKPQQARQPAAWAQSRGIQRTPCLDAGPRPVLADTVHSAVRRVALLAGPHVEGSSHGVVEPAVARPEGQRAVAVRGLRRQRRRAGRHHAGAEQRGVAAGERRGVGALVARDAVHLRLSKAGRMEGGAEGGGQRCRRSAPQAPPQARPEQRASPRLAGAPPPARLARSNQDAPRR